MDGYSWDAIFADVSPVDELFTEVEVHPDGVWCSSDGRYLVHRVICVQWDAADLLAACIDQEFFDTFWLGKFEI